MSRKLPRPKVKNATGSAMRMTSGQTTAADTPSAEATVQDQTSAPASDGAATDDVARIPEVAEAVAELDGVSEVYSVTGDCDLIAMVRERQHDQLADVIADRINKTPGITQTSTHIAFRTYSRHDLEAAFAIGLD